MEDPNTYKLIEAEYDVEIRKVEFDEETKKLHREVSIIITIDDFKFSEDDLDLYWLNDRLSGFYIEDSDDFDDGWCDFDIDVLKAMNFELRRNDCRSS